MSPVGRVKVVDITYLPDAIDLHLSCGHVATFPRPWLDRPKRGPRVGRKMIGKWGRCRSCRDEEPAP